MSTVRDQVVTKLSSVLKTASVKTVVQAIGPLDLSLYVQAQLPLVQVVFEAETLTYETAEHALFSLGVRSTVFFLESEVGSVLAETLVQELKDALGQNPTLTQLCEGVQIKSVTLGGELPMFSIVFDLEVLYEKSVESA